MWQLGSRAEGVVQGRGAGPGTAAHWEAQPLVVAQALGPEGAAAALRTRPLPQPTASSLVVESFVLWFSPGGTASILMFGRGTVLHSWCVQMQQRNAHRYVRWCSSPLRLT